MEVNACIMATQTVAPGMLIGRSQQVRLPCVIGGYALSSEQ